MTEKEQKAIEIVNSLKEWGKIHFIVKDRSYARLNYDEVYLILNYISNLQKENEELKETLKCTQDSWFNDTQKLDKLQKENSKLNKENQALYESINCDDDNMLAREYQKLKKELDKKDICLKACEENLIKERQERIRKDKVIDLMADKLSERSEWYTKERWKEICYKQVEEKDE